MDTIVALATAPMNSAIHIIRVNGNKTYKILNQISDTNVKRVGYRIQRVWIKDHKQKLDQVLLIKFVKPKSFTGEDIIEINCHGGYFLANKILQLLIKCGCRLANPGEFSQRAFMNNKMSLIEAKNINNLINASSETAINFANSGFDKTTHLALNRFKKHIFQLLAQVEINIDYPEYDDVPDIKPQQFIKILDHLIKEMSKIIMHSKQLIAVNQGINIAIIGKPNVGKSSLLNAILNSDRVIVSPLAGTTRDVIKESVNIDGITFNFLDTAGIYFTNHKINQLSINKTKEAITRADLILFVVDGSIPLNSQDRYIENLIKTKKHIVVINKSDLISNCHIKGIKVSAKNKKLNNLFEKIIRSLKLIDVNHHSLLLPSTVLIGIMQHCVNNLNKVKKIAIKKQPIDLSLSYLHEAFDDVLSITGENKNIDFVNEMFKHFCVGK